MRHTTSLLAALLAVALAGCGPSDAPDRDDAAAAPADATAGTLADADADPRNEDLPVTPPRIPDEPPPRRMPGSEEHLSRCDAEAARGAVGKVATAEVVEQARRDAGADVVRTLTPGQMVTMEFHGSRLNLDVDDANVVQDVRCG